MRSEKETSSKLNNYRINSLNILENMDAGVKLILLLILLFLVFFSNNLINVGILLALSGYIMLFTGLKKNVVIKSVSALFIVICLPYLFGILISVVLSLLQKNIFCFQWYKFHDILLRVLKLFLLVFLSELYLHTTPIKLIANMLYKVFFPFKYLRYTIKKSFKIFIIIVNDIHDNINEFKKKILIKMKPGQLKNIQSIKVNLNTISAIIVSLIVDSFEKIQKIQDSLENEGIDNLDSYVFRITKYDLLGIAVCAIITILIIFLNIYYFLDK